MIIVTGIFTGCMAGIIPHLSGLLPFLISCLEDPKVVDFCQVTVVKGVSVCVYVGRFW